MTASKPQESEATRLPSDTSLLAKWRGGCQKAAQELYDRYGPRVRGLIQARLSTDLAQRLDPEDVVQSIFRRFFIKVREGDYDVPRGEDLWGLFLVIALNKLRSEASFHRADKRDVRRTVQGELLTYVSEARSPKNEETFHILQLTIEEILQSIPEQHRVMIEMRIEGHEILEIARVTGRSKRTVERCLHEIRSRLREKLRAESGE